MNYLWKGGDFRAAAAFGATRCNDAAKLWKYKHKPRKNLFRDRGSTSRGREIGRSNSISSQIFFFDLTENLRLLSRQKCNRHRHRNRCRRNRESKIDLRRRPAFERVTAEAGTAATFSNRTHLSNRWGLIIHWNRKSSFGFFFEIVSERCLNFLTNCRLN